MLILNLFATPLLKLFPSVDQETFMFFSFLIGAVMTAPLWAWVCVQYLLKRNVERWLLKAVMVFVLIHSLLFVNWYVTVPMCALSAVIFSGKRRNVVVETTFTVLCHWLTSSYCYGGGKMPFYFLSAFFLLTTASLNLIFRYPGWKQWIKGEHVSMIPSYTFSTIFMMVLQFNFIEILAI